jgi:hypothetical protein
MQVVLQGSLRHFGAAELLSFLCGRGESGTLNLEAGDRRARVLFLGDLIVWAESSERTDPKDAVLELFDWHSGTFTVVDSVVVPDNVYPLLDSAYTLGRAPDNTISIADGSVSSRHARILRTPEGFVLEDLQSRNGTFVNGEQVADKRLLADGDLIRLGKIIMTFNVAREGKAGEQTMPEVKLA